MIQRSFIWAFGRKDFHINIDEIVTQLSQWSSTNKRSTRAVKIFYLQKAIRHLAALPEAQFPLAVPPLLAHSLWV